MPVLSTRVTKTSPPMLVLIIRGNEPMIQPMELTVSKIAAIAIAAKLLDFAKPTEIEEMKGIESPDKSEESWARGVLTRLGWHIVHDASDESAATWRSPAGEIWCGTVATAKTVEAGLAKAISEGMGVSASADEQRRDHEHVMDASHYIRPETPGSVAARDGDVVVNAGAGFEIVSPSPQERGECAATHPQDPRELCTRKIGHDEKAHYAPGIGWWQDASRVSLRGEDDEYDEQPPQTDEEIIESLRGDLRVKTAEVEELWRRINTINELFASAKLVGTQGVSVRGSGKAVQQ